MRVLILLLALSPLLASAQIYRWTDAQGRVHFGQRPVAGATAVDVRPQVVERDQATREREAGAARFFDARRAEQAVAAEKSAEEQAALSRQCAGWRQQRNQLADGRVFYRMAENGEREFYSDAQVDATRQQLDRLIAQGCD